MAAHELRIEIEVAVKKSPKVQITEQFLRESVAYWVENGIPFPGVKVTAVLWTRDGGQQKAARSESTIEEAREPAALVAMQAILGSDRNREALNLMRALSGTEGEVERVSWNILYSRKL